MSPFIMHASRTYDNAIHFILTEGGIHDSKQAENLLEAVIHEKAYVLGDKGYTFPKLNHTLNSLQSSCVSLRLYHYGVASEIHFIIDKGI